MDRRRLVIFLLIILVLIAGLILSADDKNFKQIDTGENPRYIGVKYPDLKAVRGTGGGEGDEVKEVWVSETYSHSIAIFDADSDRLKGRIELSDPGDIDFGRENAYVVSKVQPYLYVIDIRDREVKKRVPIGFPATDVEVLESKGKLYVANFLGHEVKVIELDSFEVVKEVEVGSGPREISITPDGKEAWVAVHNIDNVSVIDTERDEVVKNFYLYDKVVGDMPLWITFSKGRAYVALHQQPHLVIIDREEKEILGSVETSGGSRAVGTSPDGEFVYDALLYRNRLEIINTSRGRFGEVVNSVPLGKTPMNLAVSPTNKVYVANTQSDTVSVVRPSKEPGLTFRLKSSLPSPPHLPWNVKTVEITGDGIEPDRVKIEPGDTVKWVNRDDVEHDVAIGPANKMWFALDLPNGNEKRSPIIEPGESWSHKFSREGEYKYWCKQEGHWIDEKGTVVVSKESATLS